MKKLITLLVLLLGFQLASAQLSILPKFVRQMYFRKDTTKNRDWYCCLRLARRPKRASKWGSCAAFFYTDTITPGTRVSSLFGYATLTNKGQTKLSLNARYWMPQNKLHLSGTISFYNFPFNFYGIGNNTRLADKDYLQEKRYKASGAVEKRLGNYFYIGLVGGGLKYFYKYDKNAVSILRSDPAIEDKRGGPDLFIGPSFTFDNRNNNTYTTKGLIVSSYYDLYQGVYSNNSYHGGFFNIEYSQFFQLAKPLILGFDIQEQSLTGSRSPFYLLPLMGSDELMRGYYSGRYRDRNYIAGQTELRYRISRRFGVVGFAGTGEVFHSDFTFPALKPNYGGGLRYFFDIQKGLAIRMDYGIGQKPAGEKRESGFYIALGQSF